MASEIYVPALFVALQMYEPASFLLIGLIMRTAVYAMIELEPLTHVTSAAGSELDEQLTFSTSPSFRIILVKFVSKSGFPISTKPKEPSL